MSPKEARPGRRLPEMKNNRSQWCREVSSFRETSESSNDNIMSPKDMNKSCYYSPLYKSDRTPPIFEKSCCCGIAFEDLHAVKSRNADTAKYRTTFYDKLCEDTRVTSDVKPVWRAESKVSRCNCSNVEHSNRDLSTRHRMATSERYTSSNDSLNECKRDFANVRRSRSSTRNILLGNRAWQVVTFIILGFICVCSGDSNQCAVGLKTPGRTWPQGDIVLEYGQSLRILCMLNQTFIDIGFPGKNSSDLVFFRNKKEIEPEFISVVNETTIEMYVEKPPPAEDMYYCKLRLNDGYSKQHEAVCLNKVVIGFKPQEPQNFTCVSHNWENFICSWDPVQNYVTTSFDLVFRLPGRAGRKKLYKCPTAVSKPLPPNTCLWDKTTDPIYRQVYEYYTFIMNGSNVLGNISVTYKFHHYAHVIPNKPTNLSVVNKTSDSALLHWSVPFPMQNFPPGLHHRVAYQHQWDNRKTWQVINITSDPHTHKRHYNLSGLEFANTKYDVRVFMKSAAAIGEDKWSQFSGLTFRTLAILPGQPPRTDIGSFEITENNLNRDVYLYWQTIPPYSENGDNFKYQIAQVEANGKKQYLLPNETTRTYATFKGISFDSSFRFEIVTSNIMGSSLEKARIYVPSRYEMPQEPLAFTKIAFDGGLYELSWKPPIAHADIVNYTIFWCDNERDRPYQCSGYLDWVHVSANTRVYNMTVPDPKKIYQFAISANTKKASSGMVWASCTVIHNKVIGKMKSVWINRIGSDFIEVGWKLECSDRVGVVEGFNIYYCPIVSPYKPNCKGPNLNTTIHAEALTIHGIINGLKPYTTYKISVAVLTKSGEGLHSDPLFNTTLEAAPTTAPQDVKVTDVTNTTMFVSWNPPVAMNGVLRYYQVYYNRHSQKVEEANSVTLKGLMSYVNYSISVAACTVSCSVRSPAVFRVTDIGVPGKIEEKPNVNFMNETQVWVRWGSPSSAGGFLNYYQIMSVEGEVYNSTKREARLPIPGCQTGSHRVNQFRVRAVNVASDGTHLKGPWSEPGDGNCFSTGPSFIVLVIIWVISTVGGLAFLLCIAYTFKRMWLKCKAMQDVEVKLPPGLAPNMKLLQKVGEQHIRQSSADSSGCSSGQESVTSSLTSDSHVSSDSGADVDPVHPPGNKLLETPPTWEASSLRQRNVGTTRPAGTNDSPRWDSYVKVAKTGEPILDDTLSLARSTPNLTDSTGCAVSPQAWSSTGYISMPSAEELSTSPSPVPKEQANQGGYSVVGVAPKPLRSKSEDTTDLPSKPTIPYVTLASLEQKSKDQKVIDSLRNLEALIEPSNETLKPMSLREKTSKPYVQTSLIDSMNKQSFPTISNVETKTDSSKTPFGTNLMDPRKPFASTFSSPRTFKQKLNESSPISKPYVAVGSIAEVTKSSDSAIESGKQKPLVSSTTGSDVTSKPYVTAAAFQMLQQRENTDVGTLDNDEIEKDSPPYNWQIDAMAEAGATGGYGEKSAIRNPSYVAVGEKPRPEQQTSTSSPYVQHQRFEKHLPQQQSSTTTDEQYSKVSVAPNTMQ